jgi:hypothetical protein
VSRQALIGLAALVVIYLVLGAVFAALDNGALSTQVGGSAALVVLAWPYAVGKAVSGV